VTASPPCTSCGRAVSNRWKNQGFLRRENGSAFACCLSCAEEIDKRGVPGKSPWWWIGYDPKKWEKLAERARKEEP
jgi:hypothetical protein